MLWEWMRRRSTLWWLIAASILVPYVGQRAGWPPVLGLGGSSQPKAGAVPGSNGWSWWPGSAGRSDGASASYQARDGKLLSSSSPLSGTGGLYAERASGGRDMGSADTMTPVVDFGEIFRFDVTASWVVARWPRVSTVIADGRLVGMRVAVVTGTSVDDIAGSLTYYFDEHRQLQRVSFVGQTGDYRRLAQFIQTHYHLEAEPSPHAALFTQRWNGAPKSVLLVRHAPIVTHASPLTRYDVWLELNRAGNYYRLSPAFEALFTQGT